MRDLRMTPPQMDVHNFSFPVNAGENEARYMVFAGIREAQKKVEWLQDPAELCWKILFFFKIDHYLLE